MRKHKLSFRDLCICALIYLAVAWAFLLTMAVNYFGWDTISLPFVTIQNFPESVRSSNILFFSDSLRMQALSNIRYLLRVTLLQCKDLDWNDIEGFGTILPFSDLYSLWNSLSDYAL